jgi:hypothetical protein
MRYMRIEAAVVAVAARAIVAAGEELNTRYDAYCFTLWLYLPVSSRSCMPSVKMTIFGLGMKIVMDKRYTRPFLLLACYFLSSELVLELLFSSTTSNEATRKPLLYTRPRFRIQYQTIASICLRDNIRIQSWSAKLISSPS